MGTKITVIELKVNIDRRSTYVFRDWYKNGRFYEERYLRRLLGIYPSWR